MKTNIKTILFLFFLFFRFHSMLGMGYGDWSRTTKNETKFNNFNGGVDITLLSGKVYKNCNEWYFYKDNIIGFKRDKKYLKNEFFVINEKEGLINTFEKEKDWKAFIHSNDLTPLFWIRWFTEDWNYISVLMLFALFWFPVSISIFLVNIYFLFKLSKRDKYWKKWLILISIIPTLILVISILGNFPSSL